MLNRTRSLVVAAWANIAAQILIVGTGGAVRLTGSGLGCTEWPNCTPESFVAVPEQGIHGLIEFGNRVFGGVVLLVATLTLVIAIRRRAGRTIVTLAALIAALTVVQALIGAVVVWLKLRPDTVSIHFFLSVVLVVLAAMLVWRVVVGERGPSAVSPLQRILVHTMTAALTIVIIAGVLTTGSGPHAGDGGAARNGLDPAVMQHVHAWPSYILAALLAVVLALALERGPSLHRRLVIGLSAVVVLQIIVGIAQSNLGLPIALVGFHMVTSVVTAAIATGVVMSLRPPTSKAVGAGFERQTVTA